MRSFALLLFFAFVLLNGQRVCAQAAENADTSAAISQVERNLVGATHVEGDDPMLLSERMAYYHVKGVSIAVIHNYKMEWAKGYGWADEDLKRPVTAQTVFQAASISKSLNSVGVLKLVQDKKLDLYTDINNYLRSGKEPISTQNTDSYMLINGAQLNWKFPYDSLSKNKKITVANLLSHTGGLTVHGFAGYEKGMDIPGIVQVLNGKPPANSKPVRSMYEPGLKFEYSGGGITITQLIVTIIAREPYEKYMEENVLKPLGMLGSTYFQFPSALKPLMATGYYANGTEVPGKHHIYPEQAAAGLWTNPTDLSKYIIETQLAYEGRSHKVLTQQITKLRLTPYVDKQTALGVFIEDFDGTKYFGHGGSNEGFRSQYYGSLQDGNGVVVMVNSDNGNIIPEIVNSVAKVYGFKGLYRSKLVKTSMLKVADSILQSYTGKYELAPDFILTITKNGTQLFGQPTGKSKFALFPETENKFSIKEEDIEIEFVKGDKGTIEKAVLYQNGPHEARKIK
ncbi:MAG: serine hydrolase [Mucilaginibacter sp.]|nr:serine hydrolase [Mucilaginibacter sp.]